MAKSGCKDKPVAVLSQPHNGWLSKRSVKGRSRNAWALPDSGGSVRVPVKPAPFGTQMQVEQATHPL